MESNLPPLTSCLLSCCHWAAQAFQLITVTFLSIATEEVTFAPVPEFSPFLAWPPAFVTGITFMDVLSVNIWSQAFLPQDVFLNCYALMGTPSLLDPPPLIVTIKGGVG